MTDSDRHDNDGAVPDYIVSDNTLLSDNAVVDDTNLLIDRRYLTQVQYRTEANLAARQSIYAYQQPRIDLVATVLDLAGLTGTETVADIGCGNGIYLAGLARSGHAGRVLGADLSPGMLAAARAAAPRCGLAVGDATALPLADGVADVTLAPHMLYHVPDRPAAVREFRRITRPGGRVLVVLNHPDHLTEMRALLIAAAAEVGLSAARVGADYDAALKVTLDFGAELLAQEFGSVRRHDFVAELVLPGTEPLASYVESMRVFQAMPDPAAFAAAVAAMVPLRPDGTFRITTHCGLLIGS
ncbi:MAG TPA: class I SAM-dependent methyltransferase [Streptosporangiaceae bacterium]